MIEGLVADGAEIADSLDGLCEFMEESLCGRMFGTMIPDITTQLDEGEDGHAICQTIVGACKD
jgi:hypothetical protein